MRESSYSDLAVALFASVVITLVGVTMLILGRIANALDRAYPPAAQTESGK